MLQLFQNTCWTLNPKLPTLHSPTPSFTSELHISPTNYIFYVLATGFGPAGISVSV